MNNIKIIFVSPHIDCYATSVRPQQLCHRIKYYMGRLSMSSYGLGNRTAKLLHSALCQAKKYIILVAADLSSSTLHDWGSGSASKNLSSSTRSLDERLESGQSGISFKKGKKYIIPH